MGRAEGFMVCMQAKCRSDWLGLVLAWLLLCRDWRLVTELISDGRMCRRAAGKSAQELEFHGDFKVGTGGSAQNWSYQETSPRAVLLG